VYSDGDQEGMLATTTFDPFYALFCNMGQQMDESSYTDMMRATRNARLYESKSHAGYLPVNESEHRFGSFELSPEAD
jgi:hypothetical protein